MAAPVDKMGLLLHCRSGLDASPPIDTKKPGTLGIGLPAIITCWREGYSFSQFIADLQAGVTVGVVALPLALAFAIASGVKPEQGLATAIVAGLIISAFGGSRVQIGGPTGAFVVVIYGIVQKFGYDGLAVATMMAGVFLILMGVARFGNVIKFVPYPVTVGFTSGIAVIIALGQVRDFFGLQIATVPADSIEKLRAFIVHASTWNPIAVLIALITLLIGVYWPRLSERIPSPLVSLLGTTLVVGLFGLPVETIEQRFGAVPSTLPLPSLPHIDFALVQQLVPAALTLAVLGAIEALLSAVVADGMIGTRHRSNVELIAEGLANIASPLFGGIPATGAIARTATNIKHGGRSPIAGIVHSLTLLLILLVFGPWAGRIPIATLSGLLILVAYNMSEWRSFVRMFRAPRSDVTVMVATFLLTVLVDLTVALEVGMVLSAFLFMNRMANLTQAGFVTREMSEQPHQDPDSRSQRAVPKGVEVFQVNGAFFFGAASKFVEAISQVEVPPRVLILGLRDVIVIDATGLHAIEELYERRHHATTLILWGIHAQPLFAVERSGLLQRIGEDNVVANMDQALARAEKLLEQEPHHRVSAPQG